MKPRNSAYWIKHLSLLPHPEGGYYKEIYRHSSEIQLELTSNPTFQKRNLVTSIYFLLEYQQVSKFHQLKSDEIWYFHTGSAVRIHQFFKGEYSSSLLGDDPMKNEQLQVIMPAGSIFGAELISKNKFALFGCMVSPGFHFNDFKLISSQQLLLEFPNQKNIILHLT